MKSTEHKRALTYSASILFIAVVLLALFVIVNRISEGREREDSATQYTAFFSTIEGIIRVDYGDTDNIDARLIASYEEGRIFHIEHGDTLYLVKQPHQRALRDKESVIIESDLWENEIREVYSSTEIRFAHQMIAEDEYIYFPSSHYSYSPLSLVRLNVNTSEINDTGIRLFPGSRTNPVFSITDKYIIYYHSSLDEEIGGHNRMITALSKDTNKAQTLHIRELPFYREEHEDSLYISINGNTIRYSSVERENDLERYVLYEFDFFRPKRYKETTLFEAESDPGVLFSIRIGFPVVGRVFMNGEILYVDYTGVLYDYTKDRHFPLLDINQYSDIYGGFEIYRSGSAYLIWIMESPKVNNKTETYTTYKLYNPNENEDVVYDLILDDNNA